MKAGPDPEHICRTCGGTGYVDDQGLGYGRDKSCPGCGCYGYVKAPSITQAHLDATSRRRLQALIARGLGDCPVALSGAPLHRAVFG